MTKYVSAFLEILKKQTHYILLIEWAKSQHPSSIGRVDL